MADYKPQDIEKRWQDKWREWKLYQTTNQSDKPKYYILDMFPYPSGAGLHVGHPLGYIATDIVARYKRMTGHNVLHPMGFDAFGLPAEQYAIQTGRHPAETTRENIARYKQQLNNLGFSYDWGLPENESPTETGSTREGRELRTSDPAYYRWTQWIFSQLFDHFYNTALD